MTKLRLLQQLREAVTFDKYGSLASGCGLVLNVGMGGVNYDDFESIRVFVDYHAFVAYVAMQFENYLEEWGDMDLNDLYDGDDDDDTISNKIKKVTGKKPQKKPSECENINELSKLKHWDEFVEYCWIVDNFKN
jgi:hypothetical protein